MTDSQQIVEVQWPFAWPIIRTTIPGFAPRRQAIIDAILAKRNSDPGVVRSNRHGWHSATDAHCWPDESIIWLGTQIKRIAAGTLAGLTGGRHQVAITECWANVNEGGGWNKVHAHYPADWVAAVYISVDEALAGTTDEAGFISFVNPVGIANAAGQRLQKTMRPRDGDIVMFPGLLAHYVHPNASDIMRISMAFNMSARASSPGKDPAVTAPEPPAMMLTLS